MFLSILMLSVRSRELKLATCQPSLSQIGSITRIIAPSRSPDCLIELGINNNTPEINEHSKSLTTGGQG